MSDDSNDEKCGYKKPPKASQFKKGRSGCPSGGHKQRAANKAAKLRKEKEATETALKDLRGVIGRVGVEMHVVNSERGRIKLTATEIIVRRMIARAMKNDATDREMLQAMKILKDAGLLKNVDEAPRPAVLVVQRIMGVDEWIKATEGELLTRNPLEGIPGTEGMLTADGRLRTRQRLTGPPEDEES